ncbi:OLC1v1021776C7 [Oldenlandia corymbosa var. corymbosa]|uniref:OLC1v1021776C7 n=2 Tax=Oldenlandia corymbosa var. corymbosa TaxID=529605 RepID=A0AAV1BWE1_OLDCO|nr:OLC1v1021776C7 [Oldenlandia corymbosa var. corymbosa]
MPKKEEIPPDEFRCRRTDGRQWRCSRRVVDGKKLCHIHYLQGRRRQLRQKVPDSLKIERKSKKICKDGGKVRVSGILSSSRSSSSKIESAKKRKNLSEVLDEALRKMKLKRGDLHLELIRAFLKRQVEKKKMKNEEDTECAGETELTRELPNGVMAISQKNADNVDGFDGIDVKIGSNSVSKLRSVRNFRSKNIEPLPISTMQVLPSADYLRKLRKCHWCRRNAGVNLIKCLKCRKQFFCGDCIRERQFEKKEIKVGCPVCRGTCSCKICERKKSDDITKKESCRNKKKIEDIQLLHYFISMLFPVLKRINQDQKMELDMEATITGKIPSRVQMHQSELDYMKLCRCNNCKMSILDYHRCCAHCSYTLCLNCCWEFCRSHSNQKLKTKVGSVKENLLCTDGVRLKINQVRNPSRSPCEMGTFSPAMLQNLEARSDGNVSCPPVNFGGCAERNLDLRCIFPSSWMKELEAGAAGLIQNYDFPESSDLCSCHSSSEATDDDVESKKIRKVAMRVESSDNILYCPTLKDLNKESLGHFQQHWIKGHPIIVRNVIQGISASKWDPVLMFCTYLEKTCSESRNKKAAIKGRTCLDWCEVEISAKQIFMGSMSEDAHVNIRHQTLKIKSWLSSYLFQEQFPSHHAELMQALPLQDYVNPISGLLNVALKLPPEAPKREIGPCIHISCGSPEDFMRNDFLMKLCYDSNDVVNILAYATDVPISAEQLKNIKILMKKYKNRDCSHSSRKDKDQDCLQSSSNSTEVKGKSSLLGDESEESGLQDMMGERLSLPDGIAKVPFYSGHSIEGQMSFGKGELLPDSEDESDCDSDASMLCSGNIQGSEDSEDECFFKDLENSGPSSEKELTNVCGAQWDIFRRQDVPKLLEYLRRHSDELQAAHCNPTHVKHLEGNNFLNLIGRMLEQVVYCSCLCMLQVVHPILDQSFFLDAFHKLRLKEEFDVQPWTFEQHQGEAVMIPAGCPYQIRKLKSCVNIVVDFISPESAAECVRLSDEIRCLPLSHKAREKVLEVRKMTIRGISAAIEDIQKLMCKENDAKPV